MVASPLGSHGDGWVMPNVGAGKVGSTGVPAFASFPADGVRVSAQHSDAVTPCLLQKVAAEASGSWSGVHGECLCSSSQGSGPQASQSGQVPPLAWLSLLVSTALGEREGAGDLAVLPLVRRC